MNKEEAIRRINQLAFEGEPFLMISDFESEANHVFRLEDVDPEELLYYINGVTNGEDKHPAGQTERFTISPIEFKRYQNAFNYVKQQISDGNTYLLNLTFPTRINGDLDLQNIFYTSHAKYKLWWKDKFVVFSPEIFVRIEDGSISSFPMKGTIDADIPNAEDLILNDEKEMAEHATIVDLIRNDMSIFASDVRVERFRYIDEIRTNSKHLLQVSSEIQGKLEKGYESQLGEIIYSLLPAGSISGAPKRKTLEIVQQAEQYKRGFYTGIVGLFDGKKFDSAVLIRYIENQDGNLIYKSGGGIHHLSEVEQEYQELIDKIYVPIH